MRNPKTVKKDVMPLSVRVQHGDRKQYSRHQPATAERMKMRLEEQVTLGWCAEPLRGDLEVQVEAATELVQVQEDRRPQVTAHLQSTTARIDYELANTTYKSLSVAQPTWTYLYLLLQQ